MTVTEPVTTQAASTALAVRDNSPAGMVRQYRGDFTQVMPSHLKPDAWVRIAVGALKKGRRQPDGRYELEVAAANNPGIFLAALLDAARLGLEPGTEQYYLTPRKVKGQLEILGIVGYQGIIELMYRAGAVASVVAECVYTSDGFSYQPGRDEVPRHEIDWDADTRGDLRLVYAYARMRDGAVSKVVVLNRAAIALIKAKAQNPTGEYSPWVTNPSSMWLKSAVRQLGKWVPTSAEYRDAFIAKPSQTVSAELSPTAPGHRSVGDVLDGDVVSDAEFVDDYDPETGEVVPAGVGEWPAAAGRGGKAAS